MPQVEQLQVYYWGPLRADPIDLAVDGINVATGPNGSGKTTSLDALKLIFGVSDLSRRPAEYIYDGGGEEGERRADRALVKVVFANPKGGGTQGRPFAAAGRGCEASEHVTAICEVTRDGKRRFAMLPGARIWGQEGDELSAEVHSLRDEIGGNWHPPRAWSELLNRAGVSRALLGVISVRQGETDKTIEGSPEALLRRVLELTGKRETLDEFRQAKIDLVEAQRRHEEVSERLTSEKHQLSALQLQARQYEEFVKLGERRVWIEEVGLPAAQRIDKTAERKNLAIERDGQAKALERGREELRELEDAIPTLADQLSDLEAEVDRLGQKEEEARDALLAATREEAQVSAEVVSRQQLIEAARALVGEMEIDEALADRERSAYDRSRDDVSAREDECQSLETEIADLEAGRPARPPGIEEFQTALREIGIDSKLIAEHLEAPRAIAAEAVLGDGVWGLVVDSGRLEEAVGKARELEYRLPIIGSGPGSPVGALSGSNWLETVGAYLAEVDVPIGQPGIAEDGVFSGETWRAFRAPPQLVLGSKARAEQSRRARLRARELEAALPELRRRVEDAQRRAMAVAQAVPAIAEISRLNTQLTAAGKRLKLATKASEARAGEARTVERRLGQIESELKGMEERRGALQHEVRQRAPQVEGYDRRLVVLDLELEELPPIPEELDLSGLGTIETLRHELENIGERLADDDQFPEEVRTELVVAHREAQERKVAEVGRLLEGRREDLDKVAAEVQRARERYDQHIRQVVGLLAKRFREVCDQAGMDGDIDLRSGETEGEFGIDVRVAHVKGEAKRSYRSSAHSSGQRAKISLLILLAAMGLEGSADLLIMDEHAAHLDSRNIDVVADVMNALKHRVQFILATPTNAEAGRLQWCDHQFAFYPRRAKEPFAPPVRIFTRRPVDGARYAEMGQLALAD